jgi:hypothetical protein
MSEAWIAISGDPDYRDFLDDYDICFALAFAVNKGWAQVNDEGKQVIEDGWAGLLKCFNIQDGNYKSFTDFIYSKTDN